MNPLVDPVHLSRRTFLGTASTAAAGVATTRSPAVASGGFFSGPGRLRVGVIGCGGRGTGAALQAAAAADDVRISVLGDLFADQLAESAGLLARALGSRFDCPAERRFHGADAWRNVLASDVDLVILAAPPATRPLHFAAAVRAGRHVYCEKPAAIDGRGMADVLAACADARRRGLSVGSGLCLRHDPETIGIMRRIQDGAVGDVRHVAVRASIGLPWQRTRGPGWSLEEWRTRNWIADSRLSGGAFVEHHVHALDKALWALGDDSPAIAVPCAQAERSDSLTGDDTHVVYRFADGRTIAASLDRRPGNGSRIEEAVTGLRGTASLRPTAPAGWRPSPHAAAMHALVTDLIAGERRDETAPLCRSTQAAIIGRLAAVTGRAIGWHDLLGTAG